MTVGVMGAFASSEALRFEPCFAEFLDRFWSTPRGALHRQAYAQSRAEGRARWAGVLTLRASNTPYTDQALDGLLPHADSRVNREQHRWIHPSSAVANDIRSWFETAGWTHPTDWPFVAHALVQLIESCLIEPEALDEHCARFAAKPESKGFHAGLVSPILAALVPGRYFIAHARSLRMLRAFTGVPWSPRIESYPRVNAALAAFAVEHHESLEDPALEDQPASEVLDLFSHWYVTRHPEEADDPNDRYDLVEGASPSACWQFTPGEHAQRWFRCLAEEYAALGWPEVGDVSALGREQFDARVAQLEASGIVPQGCGVEHLWRFARSPVGTLVVASRSGESVIGVGRVSGPYRFHKGEAFPHRVPVEWFDTSERVVTSPGVRRALMRLDPAWVEENLRFVAREAPLPDVDAPHAEPIAQEPEPEPEAVEVKPENPPRRRTIAAGRLVSGSPFAAARAALDESRKVATVPAPPVDPAPRKKTTGPSVFPPEESALKYVSPSLRAVFDEPPRKGAPDFHALALNPRMEDPLGEESTGSYSLARLAEDTYLPEDELERWVTTTQRKGQAIVFGPPGTGKTHLARHLARHLVSGGDGFIEHLLFHPSYTYANFIGGERTAPLGRFGEFLARAAGRHDPCVLIIDEINRADVARVFGEALYALERRGQPVRLASGGELSVPANVRVLATMGTGDRAHALSDAVVRRRFAFVHLPPRYDVLDRFLSARRFDATGLIATLKSVNRAIQNSEREVGVVYFLREDLTDMIEDIWEYEVLPLLQETFESEPEKVLPFRWERVREVILRKGVRRFSTAPVAASELAPDPR